MTTSPRTATLAGQLTLDLSDAEDLDKEVVGRTSILDAPCPCCGTMPAPLRAMTSRVSECRFCRCIVSHRPDGLVVAVPGDKRIKRGADFLRKGARQG